MINMASLKKLPYLTSLKIVVRIVIDKICWMWSQPIHDGWSEEHFIRIYGCIVLYLMGKLSLDDPGYQFTSPWVIVLVRHHLGIGQVS